MFGPTVGAEVPSDDALENGGNRLFLARVPRRSRRRSRRLRRRLDGRQRRYGQRARRPVLGPWLARLMRNATEVGTFANEPNAKAHVLHLFARHPRWIIVCKTRSRRNG